MIYQCDAHKMITLNDRARTYTVINLDEAADAANAAPADTSRGARSSRAGGVVNVTSTSKDTGEHKKMQGYDARHLTTSMTVDGSASSCGGEKSMKMQVDGWYADIPNYMACANSPKAAYAARPRPNGGCNDKVNFKQEGSARLGFPMDVTTTMTDDKGQTFSIRQETVGVSTAPLDASLFDVPAGYTEAGGMRSAAAARASAMNAAGMSEEDRQAMVDNAMKQAQSARQNAETQVSRAERPSRAATGDAEPAAAPAAAAPTSNAPISSSSHSAAGKGLKIGVVQFDNHSNQTMAAEGVRGKLIADLQMMNAQAVALPVSSSDPRSKIDAAAKAQGCAYVLYSDIADIKGFAAKRAAAALAKGKAAPKSAQAAEAASGSPEATLKFKLFPVDSASAALDGSTTVNVGSSPDDLVENAVLEEAGRVIEAAMQQHPQ
jgi:hypothetical protein